MASDTPMTPASFLAEELEHRIKKNSNYSLRSFAQALGLSPGELSEILRGKRKVSFKAAMKITKGLLMSPLQSEQFFLMVQYSEASRAGLEVSAVPLPAHQLSEDVFRVISDWYCVTILTLAEIRNFKLEPTRISKTLGISITEARNALGRLERVGALQNVHGRLMAKSDYYISQDEIPSEAVRNYHSQLLDKAKRSLDTQTIHEREVGGITFAVDPKQLSILKKDLKKFLDTWADKVNRGKFPDKTEVYHLEMILFRLTEGETT